MDCFSDAFEQKAGTTSFDTCFEGEVGEVNEFVALLVLGKYVSWIERLKEIARGVRLRRRGKSGMYPCGIHLCRR